MKRDTAQRRVDNLRAQIELANKQILLPGLENDFHAERIKRLAKKLKSAEKALSKTSWI